MPVACRANGLREVFGNRPGQGLQRRFRYSKVACKQVERRWFDLVDLPFPSNDHCQSAAESWENGCTDEVVGGRKFDAVGSVRGILDQHGVVFQMGIAVADCVGEAQHPRKRGDVACGLDAATFQESCDGRDGSSFNFRILRGGGHAERLGKIFLMKTGYGKLAVYIEACLAVEALDGKGG